MTSSRTAKGRLQLVCTTNKHYFSNPAYRSHNWLTSTNNTGWVQSMEDDYERVLLIKSEVFVYRISVQAVGRGHRAANWKLDNPDWVGRARLVSIGSKVVLKLEDRTTGALFAKCPIDSYPSPAVEPVLDSSRYFVIRLQDDSGRTAWIGLGFADRGDSFDLNVALRDHFRFLFLKIAFLFPVYYSCKNDRREELNEEIEREQNDPDRPKLDLGFKEGQTITLNIGKRAASSSSRPKTTPGGDGPVPLLPPPPGHSLKNRIKQKVGVMPTKAGPSSLALLRLRKDAVRLMRDPVPYVTAVPLPSNILEWHYIVEGPNDTPFEGGFYHGKLVFPADYPFKPPSIYMFTPNGRFMTNCRLCLSISDFHPDTWNPAWSVGAILTGLLSFMLESSPTLGSVSTTASEVNNLLLSSFVSKFSLSYLSEEKVRMRKSRVQFEISLCPLSFPRRGCRKTALGAFLFRLQR
ncbi:Ubiquitin-conjugating enzyme E2 J2 [Trichuris trichiura]|uniref:Ubiquitin-conjugating enzyme E2 J2 n=1 Tax=Trichuris trichiura TaxID=36087 RepID=A0A077ZEF6_TRITR|nr:Ubiquitin-conjugating enzyme E2 J2 [Trichuris trichiura]